MFNFFGLLLSGAYVGGKILNEKGANIEYERQLNAIKIKEMEFDRITQVDYALRTKLKADIQSGLHVEEIYSKLHDDFKFIFGEKYKEKIILPGSLNMSDRSPLVPYPNATSIALDLLLSQRGMSNVLTPFNFSNHGSYPYVPKLYQRIEHNLRNTAGKKPRCPEIRIVQIPTCHHRDEWSYLLFAYEHTLMPNIKRKRLW